MRFCVVRPRGSGDVEMRPFRFVNEFLNKHRAHNRSGFARRADIFDVGNFGFDSFAVFFADRKLPEIFAGFFAASDDFVNQIPDRCP